MAKTVYTNGDNYDATSSKITVDEHDDEIMHKKIQFMSENQSDQTKLPGHYVAMYSNLENDKEVLSIRADGRKENSNTIWKAWFTSDESGKKVVVLENDLHSKEEENRRCVLCVKKDKKTGLYVVKGEIVHHIPTELRELHNYSQILFYKEPRDKGSTKSLLISAVDHQCLYVGFDSYGKPLPLDEVDKYSKNYEAYFKFVYSEK